MSGKATAVDVGGHTTKAMCVKEGRHGLQVTRFCVAPTSEGGIAMAEAGIPLKGSVAGLAGRDMTLRYSQVPPTPDWQLRNLMDLEIQDLAAQSGGELSADYNLLPIEDEEGGMDTVLLALARNEALGRIEGVVQEGGGSVDGYVPNCIALYNAYLKAGPVEEDTVVCLANTGYETMDIALVRGLDLLFARNLSGGGKVLDDAIASAFNVSSRKAEALKKDLLDLDPGSRGRFASGQAEKVTMAAGGAASAIVSGIQSSLAFCKSQTRIEDLRLDKVLLCGGSSRIRGLRGMLREALRCPVEDFDPFANLDLSSLPEDEAELLRTNRAEAVVALGLCAGRLDDTLYSLEILPERVRRRKRFAERTIYNVAAVLIAVLLLVLYAKQGKTQLAAADQKVGQLRVQKRRAESVHEQAAELVEQNRTNRALVSLLAEKSVPLHGTVRTLRALSNTLPDELWLQKLRVERRGRIAGAAGNAPLLIVEGAGKELGGVDVMGRYLDFYERFRRDPNIPQDSDPQDTDPRGPSRVVSKAPETSGSGIRFELMIDFRPEQEGN